MSRSDRPLRRRGSTTPCTTGRGGRTPRAAASRYNAGDTADGLPAFEASIIAALADADPELDAVDATVWAYSQAAAMIVDYPELVRAREALVASSQELQERDLMKMASLTTKAAAVLVDRGIDQRKARFAAQAGASIFTSAISDWAASPEGDFELTMQNALNSFRAAVGSSH